MSETIEEIKETIENLKTGVFDRTTGTKELFLPMFESLITTIESQKEEIERHKANVMAIPLLTEINLKNLVQGREIESLKVITELAVKGLEEVIQATSKDNSQISDAAHYKACNALEKIERIQNET